MLKVEIIMEFHRPVILFLVLDILIFAFSFTKGTGCRTLSITNIFKDKALTNHTIRTIQPITDARVCRIQCYLEPSCLTYNLCEKQGGLVCELTNSDHVRSELVDKQGCAYHGSENKCSSNPCSNNATCQGDFLSDPVPYKCVCPAGYGGDYCLDIDECAEGTHDCHVHATCKNTIGGFNCSCKNEFYGNGKQCHDIDECAKGTHDCHVNATCKNQIGGFDCICNNGFHGNGKQCQDIDECTSNGHNCDVNALCTNSIGGFNCSCKQCYAGNGTQCSISDVPVQKVLFDFESGDINGWTLTGTVFNNQPTYGDNSAKRGKPSNLQGNWYIGGFENRPSPSHTYGAIQGDGPQGTMTSPPFVICRSTLSFRIGGGCTMSRQRAELLIGGNVVAKHKGPCSEYMVTKSWNVGQRRGQTAQVRIVDNHGGGWGHINFDYLVEHR